MRNQNHLYIPEKIQIGFQNRPETYTGKLAFLTFKDAKGVLKKEKTWNGWRDKDIPIQEIDNVPTSGFVLNRNVGGGGGWNPRQAWIRVWDPRGFEFEISLANHLFILEETSSIKGKGLEGDFVYSWDGNINPSLVLLPVTAKEYASSTVYTGLQSCTPTELKEGYVYLTKDTQECLYLGLRNYYPLKLSHYGACSYAKKKIHVFLNNDGEYLTFKAPLPKLAKCISTASDPNYPNELDKYQQSLYGTPPTKIVFDPYTFQKEDLGNPDYSWNRLSRYHCQDGKYYPMSISRPYGPVTTNKFQIDYGSAPIIFRDSQIQFVDFTTSLPIKPREILTETELQARTIFQLSLANEVGGKLLVEDNNG